ncbi:MAG TPA: FtsX-like permease family protein [Candidatus Methylomirabilis sp.]|nr:FtsX-like permease family protein [Candidatus Methylomirabilis sp.]
MSPLLWRASRRHLARHPWQIGLSIVGIALGVAVALSIDLATASARRAFELSAEAVTGRATHQIVGGPSGLSENVYRMMRLTLGIRRAAPVLEFDVALPRHPGETLHLFGIDPFAEGPFRPHLADIDAREAQPGAGSPTLARLTDLVARPSTALMSSTTAQRLGLRRGDMLDLRVAGTARQVTLVGWLEPADQLSARALESLLVTDIATAQELAGMRGRITRIDLIVPDDAGGRTLARRIRDALPRDAEIVPAGARTETALSMTRAFTLNLTALSLLALVVGMFLIYNTVTFSVVQRRALIGMLRALGVTRGEVFVLVLVEALAVGVIGTLAGLLLGIALARGLLGLVTRTINDLYFVVSVHEPSITGAALARATLLGVGATLVAALGPAAEAGGARPREALSRAQLESRARRMAPRAAAGGVALLIAGVGSLLVPGGGVGWGFVGLFALLMGAALATPAAAVLVLGAMHGPATRTFGLLGRMAARGIVAALSRTGVAIAALMIAISATIGVGIMIASFREAVVDWLQASLQADIYVAPPSLIGSRPDATLDDALVRRLVATPGVVGTGTSRGSVVRGPNGPVRIVALGLEAGRTPGFKFREGRPDVVWRAFDTGAVIVSEPFANRHGVGAGGSVRLRTDQGEGDFLVAGVFYDYGSSAGTVVMSRDTYDRFWDDGAISALALYAVPGADVERLIATLRARAAGEQDVIIRSNRALRDASLQIFDRTFAITAVLRLLIIIVAFVGVLSALMALQLERAREHGVLRVLGLTPGQVWRVVTAETSLMGVVAGILAIPVGIMLAAVLVFVINRRSFGWTMPLDIAPTILAQGLLLAIAAAFLAGLYPAWKMAAASAAEALRDE